MFEQWNRSFLNGEWVEGKSARTYDNTNPYDGSLIASVRLATKEQLADAFLTAKQAQKEWAQTTAETKKEVLRKAADCLRSSKKRNGKGQRRRSKEDESATC
ncbi:aldehyde dehydrogenase family protein [Anoxybacillus geothermalis]|nr:aldehyde dehydrogenase family protein [Anoxybacillus geothermalis]MED4925337.1 aldehyde dehydrogenase family protein [Anoxybacillus geothermalis]WJQ12354.1 aldehyde dehydrogenase family protein [Geobacillus stearothermophilus]